MDTALSATLLTIASLYLVGWWRTFEKAGRPGWTSAIPIYNFQVALEIAGHPAWWVILLFLPPINIFVALVWWMDFAGMFGRRTPFALGLAFPPTHLFFMLYLGLSDIEYEGQ
jgi:hypothetical protein